MEAAPTASPAPGMKRATTTGEMPDKPSTAVTFEEGGSAAGREETPRADLPRVHSEPHGREIAFLREKTRKNVGEKQPVFLKDIHLGPKDDSIEQIQVKEARTRVRVDRLKQGRKVKLDEKGDDEKLNLTFRMMLGVRVAVGRMASPFLKDEVEPQPDDFTQAGSGRAVVACGDQHRKVMGASDVDTFFAGGLPAYP